MRDGSSTFLSTLFSLVWALFLIGVAIVVGVYVTQELDVVVMSKWALLPEFLSVPLQRQSENAILVTLAGVIAGFLLLFLGGYLFQALFDALRLGLVARSLKVRARRLNHPKTPPVKQWRWFYYPLCSRLWREFSQSLHPMPPLDVDADEVRPRYYATMPAEVVFSQQSLVDVPMRVEFFRHLPGILTGAGIVSTFAGILMGLTGFDPSVDVENVTHELQGLFMGVSTAFTASFFAILTAILVTVLEKFILHWRYAQVSALQGVLNQAFGMHPVADDGGQVGSSKLAENEALSQQMSAFFTRMESMLSQWQEDRAENQAIRQVVVGLPQEAALWRNQSVEQIGGVLSAGLTEPLAALNQIVERLSARNAGDQEEMRALQSRLTTLGSRLETHLEGQLRLMESEAGSRQALFTQLDKRLSGLSDVLAENLSRQVSLMEKESEQRQGVFAQLDERLMALGVQLENHQSTPVAVESQDGPQHQRLVAQLELLPPLLAQLTRQGDESTKEVRLLRSQVLESLSSLLEQLTRQGDESTKEVRLLRTQALDAVARLQTKLVGVAAGWPSTEDLVGLLESAALATESGANGRHQRLVETIQAGHEQMLSQVDAGFANMSGQQAQGWAGVTGQLLAAFSQRMDAMVQAMQAELSDLAARIEQERSVVVLALQDLRRQVENAALADEEGMALLFAEMGKEMEQLRRQVREAEGRVASKAQEMVQTQDDEGEENLQFLVGSISAEVKSALQSLAETRIQLDQDRESALVERLLSYTSESSEGVKVALLAELDATAKQLTTNMRSSDEDLLRLQEESSKTILNLIAQRIETAFGGVSEELAEMRNRLVIAQKTMEKSLAEWVQVVSKSTMAESKLLAQRIMDVQTNLDNRHQGVIGVIDQLGQGLEQDLEALKEGLYHKNEESAQHVEQHLAELGSLLEGVVTSLGREQAVFIEMLGERLDSLRRRLKVK